MQLSSSVDNVDSVVEDELRNMSALDEAGSRGDSYEVQQQDLLIHEVQQQDLFGLSLHAALPKLPMELAQARVQPCQMRVQFSQFVPNSYSSSSSSELLSLAHLSPPFSFQPTPYNPMVGSDLVKSSYDPELIGSPLPSYGFPISPMSPFLLDCRGQVPSRQPSFTHHMQMSISPMRFINTPTRSISAL